MDNALILIVEDEPQIADILMAYFAREGFRTVTAGDVIDLGDRVFEVLHVPGHSPGSIALWEAASGVLLSGDAVYDGPLVDDAYHSDIPTYLETMARLSALPVTVVHGGHFASFGRARFQEVIREYLDGRRRPGCPSEAG